MASKRPYTQTSTDAKHDHPRPRKRRKTKKDRKCGNAIDELPSINHPVLSYYYARILTLRQWLSEKLQDRQASRKRRGFLRTHDDDGQLLDNVLVGVPDERTRELATRGVGFEGLLIEASQACSTCKGSAGPVGTAASVGGGGHIPAQHEIVNCAIWLLFHRIHREVGHVPHLLCRGFQRSPATRKGDAFDCSPPGVLPSEARKNADVLKRPEWHRIAGLLGAHGYPVMLDLLLHCGVFIPVETGSKVISQICGMPISDMEALKEGGEKVKQTTSGPGCRKVKLAGVTSVGRSAAEVIFLRHRILYARAGLGAEDKIRHGLQRIHALNRYSNPDVPSDTINVLKSIFPRQFQLHNVFTSPANPKGAAQPFKNHTVREHEVDCPPPEAAIAESSDSKQHLTLPTPKRLRGELFRLVTKLQYRHRRCPYKKLLAHYCPLPGSQCHSNSPPHFTSLANDHSQVSAFCRATTSHVIPYELLGETSDKGHNWAILMRNVDTFIKSRRFESHSLSNFLNGIKIGKLACFAAGDAGRAMARSETQKRTELVSELLHWIFDSFLVSLVRCNFYVTESAQHKHRLFYFRQEAWQTTMGPANEELKRKMLEPIDGKSVAARCNDNLLGYSQLRLVPKDSGTRPIANLKRRMPVVRNGVSILGKSINSLLTPAFNVLKFEKGRQPDALASSLFSVNGVHRNLVALRQQLQAAKLENADLYFAKVDVKACFDTLPQDRLLEIASALCKSSEYNVAQYTEIKPALHLGKGSKTSKPLRKFHTQVSDHPLTSAIPEATKGARHHPSAVLLETGQSKITSKDETLQLLQQHIQQNTIKIGSKFWRQRKGIAQGSILSSLLCSLCYTDFEKNHLAFLTRPSLFMRLIDDFIVITPYRDEAVCFLELMFRGVKDYGITVRPEKCLTNFHVHVRGSRASAFQGSGKFPYCGMLIDEKTLNIEKMATSLEEGNIFAICTAEIEKGFDRRTGVEDSLTVDYSKLRGQTFRRKILGALQIKMQAMLFDTSHNDIWTVSKNLFQVLMESAMRSVYYIKSVRGLQRAAPALMRKLIEDLSRLACAKVTSRRVNDQRKLFPCSLSKQAVQWLTLGAFIATLRRRPANYRALLRGLRIEAQRSKPRGRNEVRLLEKVVDECVHRKGG